MKIPMSDRAQKALRPPFKTGRWVMAAALVAAMAAACDVHSPSGPGDIAAITVTPDATMEINGTHQFTATAVDGAGNAVSITPTWSVEAGGGTIDGNGLFTAGTNVGTFENTVVATSGSLSGSATVTVNAGPAESLIVSPDPRSMLVNGVQAFTASAEDAGGNPVVVTASWSVEAGGGTIDPVTGMFTAGTVGGTFTNTVMATSGALSGFATVTVVEANNPASMLGAAAPNGIIAGTEVTCIDLGTIDADVSIHPGSTVSGFPPCVITGVQELATAVAEQAQIDLVTAYNTLAGLPCDPANAIVADLGDTTLPAGVYCTESGIGVSGIVTLDGGGDPDAVFVFQAGTSLTTAGDVVLINGAQAANVYWQVGSSATLGTASHWQGNILALTSITLVDDATLHGRALARNGAVTLGTSNSITLP